MPMKKKRRTVTPAQLEKAKYQATGDAVRVAMAIFFTVMCDKEGADVETMQRIWREVEDLSDSVSRGYVSAKDMRTVLDEEYDIRI